MSNEATWKTNMFYQIAFNTRFLFLYSEDSFDKMFENELNEQEKDILIKRFRDDRSLASVGEEYGLTKERIRVIQEKAFFRMKKISLLEKYFKKGSWIGSEN